MIVLHDAATSPPRVALSSLLANMKPVGREWIAMTVEDKRGIESLIRLATRARPIKYKRSLNVSRLRALWGGGAWAP